MQLNKLMIFIIFAGFVFSQCDVAIFAGTEISVRQGQWAIYTIRIVNNNFDDRPVNVNLICPFEDCRISESQFTLAGLQNKTIEVKVYAPEDAFAGAYSIPVNFELWRIDGFCTETVNLTMNIVGKPIIVPENTFVAGSPDSYKAGRRGEMIEYDINVANWINQKTLVDVSILSNPFPNEDVEINPIMFDLGGYETRNVKMKVNIRGDAPGGYYEFLVKVKGWQQVKETVEIIPLKLYVGAPEAKLVVVEQPNGCINATHDIQSSFRLKIRNDGAERSSFSINADGMNAVVSPSVFELKTGEFTWVTLSFVPGREIANGTYNILLEAKSGKFVLFKRNYCVDLNVLRNVSITGSGTFTIPENGIEETQYIIKNEGTGTETFNVRIESIGIIGLTNPSSVTLLPGEGKTVKATIIGTKVGSQVAKIIVETKNVTFEKEISVNVVKSEAKLLSTMRIGTPEVIEVVRGMVNEVLVTVTNEGSSVARTVTASITGVPIGMSDTSISVDLFPTQQYTFKLKLNVSNESDIGYEGKIKVFTDAGYNEKIVMIRVVPALKKVKYDYTTVEESANKIVLIVNVKNEGNVELDGIKPEIKNLPKGWLTRTEPNIVNLKPKESQNITMYIFPVTESASQEAFINLAGIESTVEQSGKQSIILPEIKIEKPEKGMDYLQIAKIVIVIALVIGIVGLIMMEKKKN